MVLAESIYFKFGDSNYLTMSRLAKKSIMIPDGVTVVDKDSTMIFKGPKGERSMPFLPYVKVKVDNEEKSITISRDGDFKQAKANTGTMWSLTKNSIDGVRDGFSKVLEIEGVGYRAVLEGKNLVLRLGFSHPINFTPPEGVSVSVEKNVLTISGIDKELVGYVAAKIRSFKKPEPYKGKGIRYQGEVVRRKAGKKTGATG